MYPTDYLYSKDHEWIRVEDDLCVLGITDFAQQELGEVVFVEYEMSGTLAGRSLRWTGIGRFELDGERLVDAIGLWDNLDLLAQLDSNVSVTAFAETAARLVAESSGEGAAAL